MRTMLIPTILLLFSSLTQLTKAVGQIKVDGCGDIYKCYVPTHCLSNAPLQNSIVMEVNPYNNINEDCPALLRIYAFTKYWVHVTIASFDPTTTSIIFRIKDTPPIEFACAYNDKNEVEGKYRNKDQALHSAEKFKNEGPIEQAEGKLRCTFVIAAGKSEIVFPDPVSAIKAQFEIKKTTDANPVLTAPSDNPIKDILTCDYSSLEFNDEVVTNKKFAEVVSIPTAGICETPGIFQMEFKPKGVEEYVNAKYVKCRSDKTFIVNDFANDISIPEDVPINIRCVADVKYFCNHAIKNDEKGTKLIRTDGNLKTKTPSALKCPDDKQFLFVDEKLILKPTFECRNYGGTEYWTVIENLEEKGKAANKIHRITPSGPFVYCTDKIDCTLKYKIPDNHVKKGNLDKNNLPECYNNGVLHVGEDIVTKTKCDPQTGEFKYEIESSKGVDKVVTEETMFQCIYPDKVDETKNKEDSIKLIVAGGIGIAVCVGLVVGSVVGSIFLSRRHISKMNLRFEKEKNAKYKRDEMQYRHFGHTRDSKKELRKAENPNAPVGSDDEVDAAPTSAPCADPTLWGEQVMDFICFSEKRTKMKEAFTKDTLEFIGEAIVTGPLAQKAKAYKNINTAKLNAYSQPHDLKKLDSAFQDASQFLNNTNTGRRRKDKKGLGRG